MFFSDTWTCVPPPTPTLDDLATRSAAAGSTFGFNLYALALLADSIRPFFIFPVSNIFPPKLVGNKAVKSPPVGIIAPLADTKAPALIKFLTCVRAFKTVLLIWEIVFGATTAYLYKTPNLLVFKNWFVVSNNDS